MRDVEEAYFHGEVSTDLASHPVTFIDVDEDKTDRMGMCRRFYDDRFSALQLVMSDRESRFPWDCSFDVDRMSGQVLLGEYDG